MGGVCHRVGVGGLIAAMGWDTGRAEKATAIGIALVSLVGISATGCGGGDDDITEANYLPKVIAALCGQRRILREPRLPQSAEAGSSPSSSPFVVGGLTGEVFNHDMPSRA